MNISREEAEEFLRLKKLADKVMTIPKTKERWRIIGKFRYGCRWESNQTWNSRDKAEKVRDKWKAKETTPNEWTRVVQIKP